MANFVRQCGSLTIADGDTDSPTWLAREHYEDASTLTIFAPATLAETVSVQIAYTDVVADQVWYDLADSTIAAGESLTIGDLSYMAIRLHSSSAVAADRVFHVNKQALAY